MNDYFIEYFKECKSKQDAIKKGFYNIWTPERIKSAFNFGNGTIKDFYRYRKDNAPKYCKIEEISKEDAAQLIF